MGGILGNWRTLSATFIAVLLVGGAYALARGAGHPPVAEASTESALLAQIATRDTDGDGLPDWQEALYGTDPSVVDTNRLGMTDGAAVERGLIVPKAIAGASLATTTTPAVPGAPDAAASGSLTDTFAKNFFSLYLSAKRSGSGAALTKDEISAIADRAFSALAGSVKPAPDFKSAADLARSASGNDALANFASAAAASMGAHTVNLPKSELEYLSDAIGGDAAALAHIAEIAKAYRDIAAGLSAVPVPPELAAADLAIINAMARISEAAGDFARVNSDPVAAMLALELYPQSVSALARGFGDLGAAYAAAGVSLPEGSAAASFVNVVRDLPAATPSAP
jgi:hypothetical protein